MSAQKHDTTTAEVVGGCVGLIIVALRGLLWAALLVALIYFLVSHA